MSTNHKHSEPVNPYLEKRRNGEETEKLESRVGQIEGILNRSRNLYQIIGDCGDEYRR